MSFLTVSDIQSGLQQKRFSAVELAKAYLERIQQRDGELGCYLHTMNDDALATAKRVDAAIARGEEISPLAGVPMAVKDVILVAGHPATAGSKILEPYIATYDATAVAKLKAQDAVLLGKTNCDEFAMGSSNENSAYKPVRNPWDRGRVPGGSSGGSAAAIAADLCVAALGSDTGGSIRQPAGLCGVVGLKPTYGAVSRYGLIAMASSFDVIGSFARTVGDARTVFEAIRGRDSRDSTSSDGSPRAGKHRQQAGEHRRLKRPQAGKTSGVEEPAADLGELGVGKIRIGIPREYFASGIDPDVERTVREAIRLLESLGCSIREVSLPHTQYGLAVYYVLMPSEVSANLARYDGIRYGLSSLKSRRFGRDPDTQSSGPQASSLEEVYRQTRAAGFGPEPRRRIMLGTYALSAGYADQYYKRALAVRQRIKRDFEIALRDVDVLATPVSPTPAWTFGEKTDDPLAMYLSDVFTVSANVAGIPGISLPCGFVEREGKRLPVGLQLLGRWFDEVTLFTVGEAYEQATDWHREHPTI
jgi:aspartyl-tRNA(Asn)/glutamyl-tRNA(Gln) amidotransferase subunit A